MFVNWLNTASLACRLLGLAIVISLVLAPLSMSHASFNQDDHASSLIVDSAHIGASGTSVDNNHQIAETPLQSDCTSMDSEGGANSCCMAFCASYIVTDLVELRLYSQDKSYERFFVNAVFSGKPEAPHRPPNS